MRRGTSATRGSAFVLLAGCGAAIALATEGLDMNATATSKTPFELPRVVIDAEPRYLVGFPVLVAVTFDNHGNKWQVMRLPDVTLAEPSMPMAVTLEPIAGGRPLASQASREEEGYATVDMMPGEVRRNVFDLSNLGLAIVPGTYRLTVTLHVSGHSRISNSAVVEFASPSPKDGAEAERLRRLGKQPVDTGAWAPFLTDNWSTVRISPHVGEEARRRLALHLFLHRALYGPETPSAIEAAPLRGIVGPVLEPEAAALQYELLHARGDVAAADALAKKSVERWPGMAHRFEQVRSGEGFITVGREIWGAEQEIRPPGRAPYTEAK